MCSGASYYDWLKVSCVSCNNGCSGCILFLYNFYNLFKFLIKVVDLQVIVMVVQMDIINQEVHAINVRLVVKHVMTVIHVALVLLD